MAHRKTIDVKTVVEIANAMLANSVDSYSRERVGIAALVERILFETNNYAGYNANESELLPASERDYDKPYPHNVMREGYDDTRRHYFLPAALTARG